MKALALLGAGIGFLVGVMGCSVGMAMSGKEDPNLGAFRVGSTRGEVELQLGSPVSSVTNADGERTDVYEYELGNRPSAGRAAMHAVLDVLTIGVWEVAGTPIEAFQGDKYRASISYDARDRVVAINQASPASLTAVQNSEQPQTPQREAPPTAPVVYDQRQAIVDRNNKNLVRLRVGMGHEAVQAIMGDPDTSEGYPWRMAWQYRTALTNVAQGVEADLTPVVFDERSLLVGWGRNFLADYRKR